MVSRKHAKASLFGRETHVVHPEFQFTGTFSTRQKFSRRRCCQVAHRLQFGVQGPVLRIVRFTFPPLREVSVLNHPVFQKPPPAAAPPNISRFPFKFRILPTRQTPPQQTEMPRLEFVNAAENRRLIFHQILSGSQRTPQRHCFGSRCRDDFDKYAQT